MKRSTMLLTCVLGIAIPMSVLAQNPAGAPPDAGSGQQAPGGPPSGSPHHGQPPSVDQRVKHLTRKLGLNADQQQQVRAILQDQQDQMTKLMQDSSLQPRQRHQQMKSIHEAATGKIRALLNDEQKPKYDELLKQQQEQMQEKRQAAATNKN